MRPRSLSVVVLAVLFLQCSADPTGGGSPPGLDSGVTGPDAADAETPHDAGTPRDTATPPDDATTDAEPTCPATLPTSTWRLTANGTRLVDELGRIVMLRGLNAGGHAKQPPDYVPFEFAPNDFQSALDAYLDRAATWGIDVLRVPFMWTAIEPQPGVDDPVYLQRLDALIDAAWARRIWTILDFHQDVYAEALCGDGFPAWTLADPTMTPHQGCGGTWFSEYFSDEVVKSSFDRFWNDTDGIQTAFGALWDRVVLRYKDRPGVIGFEVLNEPGWGNATMAVWEVTTLPAFYTTMASRIHAQAPGSLVFFDLPGIDALTVSTSLQRPQGDNLVFAPHYYQPLAMAGLGSGDPTKVMPDLKKWADLGTQWGVPTFVGEFGVSHQIAAPGPIMTAHWAALDALAIHGTEWDYSVTAATWNDETLAIVQADGSEYPGLVGALCRLYPRAVAGGSPAFSYDPASRTFTLDYTATPGGTTEIVVPSRIYPAGRQVTVTGACADESRSDGIVAIVAPAGAGPVHVTITPLP
jgi:endoglycosylceramidase